MNHPSPDDQSDPAANSQVEPSEGAAEGSTAGTGSATVAAALNVEPLVFGELEDEDEKCHTPLTGSRASSGNLDVPPAAELAALTLGGSTVAAAAASVLSKAGDADTAATTSSTSASADNVKTAEEQHTQQQAGEAGQVNEAAGAAGSATPADDDVQPPHLSAAADEAAGAAAATDADIAAAAGPAQQQVWSHSSGLVTLSQLAAGQPGKSDSHTDGSNSGSVSDSDSQSDAVYAEYQQAAAAAAGEADNRSIATAQAEPDTANTAAAAAATTSTGTSSSDTVPAARVPQQQQQQQQQQQAPDRSRSSSPLQHQRLQHIQQQQQRRPFSPPRSPLSPRSPASGLERTASWQLQHAAAAAAGTAAHAAPPRSDLHLARLGSGAGSPRAAAAAGSSAAASAAAAAAADDGWSAWQRRRRHFFVLTAAGKPVFSRHGDEQALAGFMAVIQALVSVVADQGDAIQSISVGSCQLVFLLAGQLYLVAVSSRGEAPAALRRQLELLYQSILMVVTGGIEKLLQRSAGYDVQQLLSGSKPSLSALTSAFSDCPGWMFGSVEPAAAAAADRQAAAAALAEAVKTGEALYGVLLVGRRVLAAATGKGPPPLNVFDLLLLVNFANSNESLRHSETFVPVCLPNFQPNAFLHAYITNIEPIEHQQQQQQQSSHKHPHDACPSSIFLLLLSGSADSFHKLSAAKQTFAAAMAATPPAATAAAAAGGGMLARAAAAAARLPGGGRLRVEALPPPLGGPVGSTPLWHAVVRFPQRKQHLTLNFPQELFTARSQRKQLVRSYCRLFCAAHAQVLEAAAAAAAAAGSSSSSSTNSAGVYGSGVHVPHVTAGGTSGSTASITASSAASSSIANIVGAAGAAASSAAGGMGSGAAAAAAAAAAYMLPYGAMGVPRSHKLVWVSSERWVTGVIIDRDVEVYVTFDPLTEKDVGLKLAESLRRLFADKARQQELLVPGL